VHELKVGKGSEPKKMMDSTHPIRADILIVGGGPAGLSTWLHLNALAPELASRAVVIERALYPREKPCGGGMTPLGEMLLGGLGIAIDVPSVRVQAVEFRFGAERLCVRQPNALRVVRRVEFDHMLATIAMDRGLELHQGETLQTIERAADALIVTTNRAAYRVHVLVGADGAFSTVRQQTALGDASILARLLKVVTPPDPGCAAEADATTAVFDFTPTALGVQGYIWHFPCLNDGAPAIDRGVYDSRIHADRSRADLKTVLRQALPAAYANQSSAAWIGHPIRLFSEASGVSAPNVLLIGDAAGVDPALGEGISTSLDYGDLAANAIIDAFQRGDFSLADYQARLFAHPVGQSLTTRAQLARAMYAEGSGLIEQMELLATALLG